MARIIIAGSRFWNESKPINELLHWLDNKQDVIITGGATGADAMANVLACGLGFETIVFQAHWNQHGKSAGPIRNRNMLTVGKPDRLFIFTHNLRRSKGTRNLVLQAIELGIPVYDMMEEKK